MAPPANRSRAPTYALVGFLGGDFGLAVAARNTQRILLESGREVVPVRIEPGDAPAAEGKAGPGSIALFHVNPLEVATYADQWRGSVAVDGPRVCVPFWELPRVPRAWERLLLSMHAVLAPTRFIQEACAAVVGQERAIHYPQTVFLPPTVQPARDAWGLSPSATVFGVAFDVGSDIERKNPWAAIEAFQQAFPGDENVQLVVKTKPWANSVYQRQARELHERVAGDGRIRIVERSLSYDEVLQLYASVDVLVSLHRSEGLGLHLMEAMSLGKVVVATDWSGNAEFMAPEATVPVPYHLIPIRTEHGAYLLEVGRAGQVWAEADVGYAARALRELHHQPARRQAMGQAARRLMSERTASVLKGGAFDVFEARLAGGTYRPDSLAKAVWQAAPLRLTDRIYLRVKQYRLGQLLVQAGAPLYHSGLVRWVRRLVERIKEILLGRGRTG